MTAKTIAKLLVPYTLLVLLTIAAGATLWAAPAEPAPTATATAWQFASLKVPVDTPNQKLGSQILKMGRDGWELVSVENFDKDGTTTETAYYFKRPL